MDRTQTAPGDQRLVTHAWVAGHALMIGALVWYFLGYVHSFAARLGSLYERIPGLETVMNWVTG